MARNQKNFSYFTYVDDFANTWNVRGEDGGAATAVDGHAALTAGARVWGRTSTRRHPRYIIYQDAVTFRTIKAIFYTPTAYNAVAIGDIVAVQVPGLATTVNYTVAQKVGEKQPVAKAARHLADS